MFQFNEKWVNSAKKQILLQKYVYVYLLYMCSISNEEQTM